MNNKPFFQIDLFGNKIIPKTKNNKNKQYTCEECGLYKNCKSPRMKLTGKGKQKILIVAEAPGEQEDERGIQLIGRSGRLVRNTLSQLGYDLDKDFWKTNSICCGPENNRTPKNIEIQACRKNLLANIEKIKPDGVIILGKVAFDSLVSYRFAGRIQDVGFKDMVGCCIPDQELGFWIFPIYHPAYLLRNENDILLKNEWRRQLKRAIRTTKEKTFYKHNYENDVFVYKDVKEVMECIKKIKRETEIIAFDYETTGIKPHREGHRIVCIGISDGIFGYAFPNFDDEEFQHQLKRLLINKNIGKIAHSIRFEEQWTRNILGYEINNWFWDSEIGYRFLYNRRKSQLKFNAYADFGILGMDETVDKYIRGTKLGEDPKDANHFNRIDEAPFDDLLKYCGLDALMSFKMYELQNIRMRENRKGFHFLKGGQISLLQSTEDGVCVDEKLLDNTIEEITKKIEKYKKQIYESDILKKWDGEEQFNQKSSTQLSHLLYDILKLECPKLTAKGGRSVDVEALQILNHPFCDSILNYRKWLKVRDTYLYQYKREIVNGRLHPNYNLNRVKTHRSSSDSPNFQNCPKRDKEIKKQIRSIIIPRNGNRLGEDDYKAIEVCVASCYTKDRNLLKYVRDKSTDMHRDMACQIFFRNKETFLKEERHDAKNGYVFPSFYGSWYKQTAPDLWERAKERSETTFQNLKDNGIRNYDDFENHIRIIEDDFWHNRFPEYNEWKEKTYHDYCKRGYMDSLTGFRYSGYMKKNEVLNYMIQGSAFHCLLWTYNNISSYIKKLKHSFLIGQIHDAILRDFHPNDEAYIDNLIIEYGTKKIREYWDWIIVPLTMEKEVSEINGSWAEMKEAEYLIKE